MIPIALTERAIQEIKHTLEHKNIPSGYGLRVGAQGSGCAGTSYVLGFDKKKENDAEYTIEGLSVYVQKKEILFLIGMEVDFYEGTDARGFTFQKAHEQTFP